LRRVVHPFIDDLFPSRYFLKRKKWAKRILVAHVRRVTVQNAAHFYDSAGELDFFTKNLGAVRRRKDGSANVQANFAAVDVKRSHDPTVARPITADLPSHQPYAGTPLRGA